MSNDTQQKIPLIRRLRTYFLTGLVVAAPIAITIWVAIWFIESVDSWFSPFIPNALQDSPYSLPGLGVIASLIILTGLGALTANIFGKTILKEEVLSGLEACNGFLRGELARRLQMRRAPEIVFHLDMGLEKGSAVLNLLGRLEDERKVKNEILKDSDDSL